MSFVPVVPALLFKAATTALANLGFSPEGVVEKAGAPPWHHCEAHTRVPGGHFYTLLGRATGILGVEEFGYLIPKYTPITALDSFGQQISESATVYEAVKTFNSLYAQMSNIDLFGSVEDGAGLWWLRKRVQASNCASRQQIELGALTYMLQTVRLGAGPDWAPEKICLEAESLSAMYRLSDFGNSAIVEGQGLSGFLIPRSLFARSILAKRSSTLPHNTSKLFSEAPSTEFLESLRQVVSSYFSLGLPRIEEIADVTGMGVRTLQRRLRENGLTYKRVVDQALFKASTGLLRDPHVKLIEVAHELGYSDQANFNRAFRRCAGITPGEYRLQLQSVQS